MHSLYSNSYNPVLLYSYNETSKKFIYPIILWMVSYHFQVWHFESRLLCTIFGKNEWKTSLSEKQPGFYQYIKVIYLIEFYILAIWRQRLFRVIKLFPTCWGRDHFPCCFFLYTRLPLHKNPPWLEDGWICNKETWW